MQAQNDFIAAMTALNKAKSALDLAQLQDKRAKDLFEAPVPLKDYQQTQATLIRAQNHLRSSQTALEAARNKLRILGLTDEAITAFRKKAASTRSHHLRADRRHRGPAQDRPRAVCRRRRERPGVRDRRSLHGLAHGLRSGDRSVIGVGGAGDYLQPVGVPRPRAHRRASTTSRRRSIPPTRRLLVRATVDNKDGQLKPEMFATVTIYAPGDAAIRRRAEAGADLRRRSGPGLGRRTTTSRSSCARSRPASPTAIWSRCKGNLKPGEQIVTKGSLFIDRAGHRGELGASR